LRWVLKLPRPATSTFVVRVVPLSMNEGWAGWPAKWALPAEAPVTMAPMRTTAAVTVRIAAILARTFSSWSAGGGPLVLAEAGAPGALT